MNIRTPQHDRRVLFARSVIAATMIDGTTQREAFRRLNYSHPTLANTFPSVESFETWIYRHREEMKGIGSDILEIPSMFEDGGGYSEGAFDFPSHVRVAQTFGRDFARQEKSESRALRESLVSAMIERASGSIAELEKICRALAERVINEIGNDGRESGSESIY